jgi:hypothetical protein
METTILKYASSVPSHEIDVFKNQSTAELIFSQGIGSVQSKPGVLKSLKFRRHREWLGFGC